MGAIKVLQLGEKTILERKVKTKRASQISGLTLNISLWGHIWQIFLVTWY